MAARCSQQELPMAMHNLLLVQWQPLAFVQYAGAAYSFVPAKSRPAPQVTHAPGAQQIEE